MTDVLLDHQAVHIDSSGHMKVFNMAEPGRAAVKQHGVRCGAGRGVFYREGGVNYMCDNTKMSDGSMLFDRMHEWGG